MRPVHIVLVVLASVSTLQAQTQLDRPPNLGGTWVPDRGVLQFNFLHRFYVSPGPIHKVSNFPTFTLALGLPERVALGLHYGTNSTTVPTPYRPNEAELFARWQLWGRPGRPLVVAITPAYNTAARSGDAELGIDWTRGRITLSGAARGMSHPYNISRARFAFAGGAVARLNPYVAIAADAASLVDPVQTAAWSAGLLFLIPGSPHMFSVHASNADINTIEGSSRGSSEVRYGFEFTIPLHLKRFSPWFHGGAKPAAVGGPAGPVSAEVRMAAFKFQKDTVVASVGQTVRWTNTDPVEHTITFDGAEPGSPPIPQNGSFSHRFDRPGTYTYHCTPHPFMKAVVVVR